MAALDVMDSHSVKGSKWNLGSDNCRINNSDIALNYMNLNVPFTLKFPK